MADPKKKAAKPLAPGERIVPAMDLTNDSRASLAAAHYHLEAVRVAVASPAIQTREWKNDPNLDSSSRTGLTHQENQLHYHLRAFFWELIATWDIILQWMNKRYSLGLREDKVRWKWLQREAKKRGKYHELKTLSTAYDSTWFKEVRAYRNLAHCSFLFVQGDWGPEGLNILTLLPVRKDQRLVHLPDQLTLYWKHMQAFVESVPAKDEQQ